MKNKVLIVDDEVIICEVAKEMFEIFGFEAFSAESLVEAESCFKEHHADIALVILDYNLPDSNGVEILKVLKSINDDFVAVLATGMYVKSDIEKYQAMGFAEVIDKPYGFDVLKGLSARYL